MMERWTENPRERVVSPFLGGKRVIFMTDRAGAGTSGCHIVSSPLIIFPKSQKKKKSGWFKIGSLPPPPLDTLNGTKSPYSPPKKIPGSSPIKLRKRDPRSKKKGQKTYI